MPSRPRCSTTPRDPDDATALICGLCEEILTEQHGSQAKADQAADGHAETVHPDESPVVVVPVRAALVEEAAEESLVAIAAQAQEKVDRGETAGPLLEVCDGDLQG